MTDIHLFTKKISDLMQSGLSLQQSLGVVSVMKTCPVNVRRAAHTIDMNLAAGTSLSNSLRLCSGIKFPELYIAFVSASEETGQLGETFLFLLRQEENKADRRGKLIGVSVYPLFVVLAALTGSFLLLHYSPDLMLDILGNADGKKISILPGIIQANIFLFLSLACLFVFLRRLYSGNRGLDVFRTLDFSLRSGMGVHDGLRNSLLAAGNDTKLKKMIVFVLKDLEAGISPSRAFLRLGGQTGIYFETAERTGQLARAVGELLESGERRQSEKEKIIGQLIEPVLLCVLAVYILILLRAVVSPLLFNYGIEGVL